MSKKKTRNRPREPSPSQIRSAVFFTDPTGFDDLTCSGYTSLAQNPEIVTGVDTIARLVGAMTIHLMENTERGDVRVKNGLSRIVDIQPNHLMTRANFVSWIIRTLYLDGNGNAIVWPRTENGYLRELLPVPPAYTALTPSGLWDYSVMIDGREYDPADVLHFVLKPGTLYPWKGEGYRVALADVANNLKQAAATEKGFMSSKWKPSLIVKVDALAKEFSGIEGRERLRDEYITGNEAGAPWIIPANQFEVQQVKPLTLSDLALADFVTLDKQTVATILGVPPFVLGIGEFKRDQWNSFINTVVMPLAENVQQELTRKLLERPDWYFRFSPRSLYNYDIKELAAVADDQYVRGIMTGNEVREWLGMSPMDDDNMDKLVMLENYIPRGMIGQQSKLLQGGETE